MDPRLDALLAHPLLWQAGMVRPAQESIATGFAALDDRLPGHGWPARGLVEVLSPEPGRSELGLFAPAIACLMREQGFWMALLAPPFEPYAPAFAAAGMDAERIVVLRTSRLTWAMEQIARSAACRVVLAWPQRMSTKSLRRLQLAAEQMQILLVLNRHRTTRSTVSPAVLRLELHSTMAGLGVEIFKSRGGRAGRVLLSGIRTSITGSALGTSLSVLPGSSER
jgi:hypothetical protein